MVLCFIVWGKTDPAIGRDGQMRPLLIFGGPCTVFSSAVNAESGVKEKRLCACARKTLCKFAAPTTFAAIKSGPRE